MSGTLDNNCTAARRHDKLTAGVEALGVLARRGDAVLDGVTLAATCKAFRCQRGNTDVWSTDDVSQASNISNFCDWENILFFCYLAKAWLSFVCLFVCISL